MMAMTYVCAMAVQAHEIAVKELKEQVLQKDAAAVATHDKLEQLQQQLAERDSLLVSVRGDLAAAKHDKTIAFQVHCAAFEPAPGYKALTVTQSQNKLQGSGQVAHRPFVS